MFGRTWPSDARHGEHVLLTYTLAVMCANHAPAVRHHNIFLDVRWTVRDSRLIPYIRALQCRDLSGCLTGTHILGSGLVWLYPLDIFPTSCHAAPPPAHIFEAHVALTTSWPPPISSLQNGNAGILAPKMFFLTMLESGLNSTCRNCSKVSPPQ